MVRAALVCLSVGDGLFHGGVQPRIRDAAIASLASHL